MGCITSGGCSLRTRTIKLITPIFQEQNEGFAPEGFQRAMRQTGAVNARKALWWGDGAKPHILKCCIQWLHCEDNRGLLCIRRLHSEHNRGLYFIRGLHCEDNRGLYCIRRLQFEDNPGLYCIRRLQF